ncbi:hypothetical protein IG631_23214 [Alternaria alternata]|nr:hypothetical protein IG631_23214 [Alternaria alternata]
MYGPAGFQRVPWNEPQTANHYQAVICCAVWKACYCKSRAWRAKRENAYWWLAIGLQWVALEEEHSLVLINCTRTKRVYHELLIRCHSWSPEYRTSSRSMEALALARSAVEVETASTTRMLNVLLRLVKEA